MSGLAPIVLFVYNRPEHTLKTLQYLSKNIEAKESKLYIFCDGPKNNADEIQLNKINETRKVIRQEQWCKEVTIVESETNQGLANSIIEGVTKIVNHYGKIIVLEDDLLTSPYFLRYMNDALEFYRDQEDVISIHAYIYPVSKALPETFFLKGADCWGWATWKRGWNLFEKDGRKLLKEIQERKCESEFDFNNSYPYLKMLKNQIEGKNDSWAVRWYASAFLKNKLTLYPGKSLVKNIGTEGSGTHLADTQLFDTEILQTPVSVNKIPVEVNQEVLQIIIRYFKSIKPTFIRQVIHKLKR